jgi:AraC family transcriptional regulator, positive regulator of tynA and feaB
VAYLEVISTDCIEPARQRPFWQAALKDKLGLASRFDGNGSLIAKLECALFRDVGIFRLTGSGYHVERTPGLITSSALGFVKVALQLSGSTKFLQGSRQVVLSSGEWTIFDNSRPYQSSNPGPVQLIVLTLPVHRLRSHRFDLDKMMLLKFSNIAGMSRLTYGLIESVFDQFEALGKKHYADLADVICHMLHMNLLEENDKLPLHSSREYLNEKFKRYILHNLRNPDLNVDRIAEDLGCSRRYLYKAFEDEPVSISEYVWNLRLDRCRMELETESDRSITEIAFEFGFSSSSHFCTQFKARFGMSPREYRSRAQRAVA